MRIPSWIRSLISFRMVRRPGVYLTLSLVGAIIGLGAGVGFQAAGERDLIAGAAPDKVLQPSAWNSSGGGLRFAVVGDFGTGGRQAMEIANGMATSYTLDPFEIVLTTGDNFYSGDPKERFDDAFSAPFRPLLDAGVTFHPTIGNHDLADGRPDEAVDVSGLPNRYYSFVRGPITFVALDTNRLDRRQVEWLSETLACSTTPWQVVYMHHPPYSSGRHGSDLRVRRAIESIVVRAGVELVLAGHDHNYERTRPQGGVVYVVTGAGAKTRPVGESLFTVVSQSQEHFLIGEASFRSLTVTSIDDHLEPIDRFELRPRAGNLECPQGG